MVIMPRSSYDAIVSDACQRVRWLTKKRIIQVSRMVKLVGRIENQDILNEERNARGSCWGEMSLSIAWYLMLFE